MAQENATAAHQWVCQIEHSEPSKLLGETYGFWCQTITLAAAAVFAGRRDEALTKAIRHIAALHDGDKNMAAFARKENIDLKHKPVKTVPA